MTSRALVLGAGGFIGSHLVKALKREGFYVRGADLKRPEFQPSEADEFVIGDLRNQRFVSTVIDGHFEEIYQLAADMGGAGYVFLGDHDAAIMHNSAAININVLSECVRSGNSRIFFSSSACVYPEEHQLDPNNPNCAERSVYPANPDSDYGWEKLFSERLYLAFQRNNDFECRIARYHNIFGAHGTWTGGREKAPAALCRKIAKAKIKDEIEIWGDGRQTRSFLYIDECIEGTIRLMRSDVSEPINIGSDRLISISDLSDKIAKLAGKEISQRFVHGPVGVRGRVSDNTMISELLGWSPKSDLDEGLRETYRWISAQVAAETNTNRDHAI